MKKPGISSTARGVALIITLALMTMLAFLVVAFFSRTTNNRQIESASSFSLNADILAKTAGETVIADLKTEIVAGSNPVGTGAQPKIYQPKAAINSVPAIVRSSSITANDPVFVNLVKQSTDRFFPTTGYDATTLPVIQSVTSVGTDTVSQNARMVSNKRWDYPSSNPLYLAGPMLFIGGSGAGRLSSAQLPHWIMITRQGIPAIQSWDPDFKNYAASNLKAAIGRFAFNLYDEGGLLDVNVAGYPSVVTSSALGQKGTLGLAQLATIPGIDSAANANAFVGKWRNLITGTKENDYLAYLGFSKNGTTDLTGNAFFNLGPKFGFMNIATSAAGADNRLLGRQDLIRLALKKVAFPSGTAYDGNLATAYGINGLMNVTIPGPTTKSALPYLTHFSRELNAPSWGLTKDASSMSGSDGTGNPKPYAYKTNADNSAVPNRFIPNVRVATAFTRATGEQAVVGEPLIKTRFPLSRLAGLGLTGPVTTGNTTVLNGVASPASNATITRDFGLSWDKTNGYWKYTAGTTAAIPAIKTLSQVAAENREPNFFELLKAGILSGSLGNSGDYESFCANIGEDANADYQIIQIGANIIDQADSDSYPTRIAFGFKMDTRNNSTSVITAKSASNAPISTGEVKVFAGVEDLPFLQSILITPYRRPAGQVNLAVAPNVPLASASVDPVQTAGRDYLNAWLQFVLWKPQQKTSSTSAPTDFRILYTDTDARGIYLDYYPPNTPTVFSKVTFGAAYTAPVLPSNTAITFSDSATSFRAPSVLGDNAADNFGCTQKQGDAGGSGAAQLPRGMWIGETFRPEKIPTPAGNPNANAPETKFLELDSSNDSRFELQYKDSANSWRTYQRYDRFGMGTISGQGYHGRGRYGYSDSKAADGSLFPSGNPQGLPNQFPHYTALNVSQFGWSGADPRSQRFGLMAMNLENSPPPLIPAGNWQSYLKLGWLPITGGNPYNGYFYPSGGGVFVPSSTYGSNNNPWQNRGAPIADPTKFWADDASASTTSYYKDLDGIVRRADGDSVNNVRPMQSSSSSSFTANTSQLGLVINRPFRSVGELSYVFRDDPWKSLDLFSTNSADSALLDLFVVNEQPSVVAGKVNLNSRNAVVLQAVIAGALREELTTSNTVSSTGSATSAQTMATNLVTNIQDTSGKPDTGPITNPAEIANRLTAMLPVTNAADQAIKTRREVIGRALAGSVQTRSWTFLIDVIAQSGRFPVTVNANPLLNFIVEGEKHYWIHVAIDRYTGQVIDQQFEPVNE